MVRSLILIYNDMVLTCINVFKHYITEVIVARHLKPVSCIHLSAELKVGHGTMENGFLFVLFYLGTTVFSMLNTGRAFTSTAT